MSKSGSRPASQRTGASESKNGDGGAERLPKILCPPMRGTITRAQARRAVRAVIAAREAAAASSEA